MPKSLRAFLADVPAVIVQLLLFTLLFVLLLLMSLKLAAADRRLRTLKKLRIQLNNEKSKGLTR